MRYKGKATIVNKHLVCPSCNGTMIPEGHIGQTLVYFPSPEGHNHDNNCLSQEYKCSKCDLILNIGKRRTCPTCDWKGIERCFCYSFDAVDEFPI